MRLVAILTLITCLGTLQAQEDETELPITLNDAKSRFNTDEQRLVTQPFQVRERELKAEYRVAVETALELARRFEEKAAEIPFLEAELTRLQQNKPENPLRQIPETLTLRNLRIYRTRVLNHEKQVKAERLKILRNQFVATLSRMEDALLRDNDEEGARSIAQFRNVVTTDWKATRSIEVDTDAVGTRQTNAVRLLPQFVGKSGRLRAIGEFNWQEPVVPPDVASMTDFVEVHAFEKGWLAIRTNGQAVIYTNRPKAPMNLLKTTDFQAVSRTRDLWVVRGDRQIWREIEGRKFNLPARRPLIVVGCHTAGLAYYADGTLGTYGSGFSSSRLGPPPADFFDGASGAIGGSTSLMVMTPDGRVRGWDLAKRKPVEFPDIDGIVEMEPGLSFGILRRDDGTLVATFLDGRPMKGTETWAIPAAVQGTAKKVRCGGITCSVQREDGTWFAWGVNPTLQEAINNLGAVMDLDMYTGQRSGYVLYIEPVE